MNLLKKFSLSFLLAGVFLSFPAWVLAQDSMNLIATEAGLAKAQAFVYFLKQNEVTVEHALPSEFNSVKNKKYITIAGGMDEPGIKEIITEVVGAEEASALAKPGAKKMFMKQNTWAAGQKILVFAGDSVESAAAARIKSRETWMKYLKEWYGLADGPRSLKAY